ncbi:efflux RND transporter periplasmic adaptor subunit [Vulgatibacter sp.]|uniref:efflux RND transporter periplasmic adaptor subunit n=1 Tax=Vulgatibacter sp. TaxID=1971226 RepID=UPI00356392CF
MRKWLMILSAALVLSALVGGAKFWQLRTGAASAAAFRPPPQAVTTVLTPEARWPVTIHSIGTVEAVRGVTLSADLPGVVAALAFESGRSVKKGQLLVRLDVRQERAQLGAAESQQKLAALQLQRAAQLRARDALTQQALDEATAAEAQAAARVAEIQAILARKQIRAPFSGELGLRQIDLGQYVASGQPIVSLQALDQVHVNFGVPQQELARLQIGDRVEVSTDALGKHEGRITAIDVLVDPQTRNVQVQATIPNAKGLLRPGMFVNTRVLLGEETPVLVLPASAIQHAPYGDSIFVVEQLEDPAGQPYPGVRQQAVTLGGSRGDQVAILAGLEAGQEVVSAGTFKLRNGDAVLVDNRVQPANDPAARPENN